jgi:ATP-dependent helicase/nuclease subunit A
VTSVALFAECPRRYYLERYLGWEAPRVSPRTESDAAKPDALDATELGQQVHALLAGAAVEGADPEAVRLAGRFHASALGRRAAATLLAEREFDFLLAVEDVVLRGQIDLWFEESGELVLVDYKTDANPDADRAQHYALQLQLYALALEKQLGKLPDRAFLYFLRPDAAVEVRVDREAAAEALAAVRRFREAQDNMDFPLRVGERCRTCPFYQRSCPAYVSGFSSMKGSG